MTWIDLSRLLILFAIFIYVFATNIITQLHKVYLLFHFFIMLWPLAQVLGHTTDNPDLQLFYIEVSFAGLSMIGFSWVLFTEILTKHAYVPSRRSLFYMLLPSILLVVGVMWNPGDSFVAIVDGHFEERSYGPIFWIMIVVLLSYYVYSVWLLWWAYRSEAQKQHRPQIGKALTGSIVYVGFALLDLLLNVVLHKPIIPGLSSIGIVISDIYFIFSIRKHGIFDIVKIAQEDVADTMSVGVIVLDDQDYAIEVNRAVSSQLNIALGKKLNMEELLESAMIRDEANAFLQTYRLHPAERAQIEISVHQDGKFVYLSMHVSPIIVKKKMIGRVITFQDHTELKKLIEQSYLQNEALQERNRVLLVMQDELFKANQKLEQLAITDGLTGCFNRSYLMQQMEHEALTNLRYRIPFAIFLFDIDLFKSINDTYGHLVGDEVIRQTADIVRGTLRRTDILARYGGEEFMVYLPHINREQAEVLAQRIRMAVESNEIAAGEKRSVNVTISMGLLAVEPQPGEQIDDVKCYLLELFARVDEALYHAKESGRNRIVIS